MSRWVEKGSRKSTEAITPFHLSPKALRAGLEGAAARAAALAAIPALQAGPKAHWVTAQRTGSPVLRA